MADLVHHVVAEALEQAHHRLVSRNDGAAPRPSAAPSSAPRRPHRAASGQAHATPPGRTHARHSRTGSIAARAATRGTVAATGVPRIRRRGSFRAARSTSGTGRAARPGCAPSRGCSPRRTATARGGLGGQQRDVVLAEHPLAHEPSRRPSWRVAIQRFASATVAFARPPPGGTTWSSRSFSSLPMSEANDAVLARTQSARVDHARTLDDARQLRPERLGQGRHDPGHRLGIRRLGGAKVRRRQAAGGTGQAPDRVSLDGRPVDEALSRGLLHPPADDGRGGPEGGADEDAGLPGAVVAPGRPSFATRHPASNPSSTAPTSGKSVPNSRPARPRNGRGRRSSTGDDLRSPHARSPPPAR